MKLIRTIGAVLAALCALCLLSFGQSSPPPVAEPGTVLAVAPESPTTDNVLFWSSVATSGLGVYASISTSWKKIEPNPLYQEPGGVYAGKFYVRGTAMKVSTFAITTVAQYYLVRKFPQLKRVFAVVNFSTAAAYGITSGYGAVNH